MFKRIALPALLLSSTSAVADAPNVVVDILPVHAMVSSVMQGVGEPALLLPPGADPHSYAMRPSEAQALSSAEIVFWVGEALTPWLAKPIEAIAGEADILELMEADGFEPRPFEKDHEGHEDHAEDDHADEDHADDDHAHEEHEHDDHAHDDHADHKEDEHEDHAGHDHGAFDPHAWLDPEAGIVWLTAIAGELATHDPENSEIYAANAKAMIERLGKLSEDLAKQLEPLREVGFVTQHDGYGYFIDRFDLNFEGAISSSEAEDPSPADLSRVRELVTGGHVKCVFSEVQLSDRLVSTALEGSDVKTVALDTLGANIEPGPAAYEALLTGLGESFTTCLGD